MSAQDLASKAREHWAKWLPERTAELKWAGTFGSETMAAAQMAQQEIDRLMASGYQEHEAEEVVLRRFILLKPEPIQDAQSRELAAKEVEYQKLMRDSDHYSKD